MRSVALFMALAVLGGCPSNPKMQPGLIQQQAKTRASAGTKKVKSFPTKPYLPPPAATVAVAWNTLGKLRKDMSYEQVKAVLGGPGYTEPLGRNLEEADRAKKLGLMAITYQGNTRKRKSDGMPLWDLTLDFSSDKLQYVDINGYGGSQGLIAFDANGTVDPKLVEPAN